MELFGDIGALSTGITIIDLPGYGDADSSRFGDLPPYLSLSDAHAFSHRNNIAEEYVKTADCIILGMFHRSCF